MPHCTADLEMEKSRSPSFAHVTSFGAWVGGLGEKWVGRVGGCAGDACKAKGAWLGQAAPWPATPALQQGCGLCTHLIAPDVRPYKVRFMAEQLLDFCLILAQPEKVVGLRVVVDKSTQSMRG